MATQQTFAFLSTSDLAAGSYEDDSLSLRALVPTQVCEAELTLPREGRGGACDDAGRGSLASEASIFIRSVPSPMPRSPARTPPAAPNDDRHSVLKELRRHVGCINTAPADDAAIMSTGSRLIDSSLPRGGLRADAINEWVGASDSTGAAVMAMIAVAKFLNPCEADAVSSQTQRFNHLGPLVVIDKEGTFYLPAAVALGISAKRIVLVRPKTHADHVWAIDQALRCEAVAAVWSHIGQQLNDRDARRFQLAAESGRTPGFLIRPAIVRGRPTFADVRLYCEPQRSRETKKGRPLFGGTTGEPAPAPKDLPTACNSLPLQITIDRCRGGTTGQKIQVQIDDHGQLKPVELTTTTRQPSPHETATMHLAARLAHPTPAQSPTDAHRRRA